MAPDGTEPLRRTIYRHFAAHGTAPDESQLAAHLGWPVAQVVGGLQQLARDRHLVLDDGGAIVMAHPFSAVPLGFSVMSEHTLWWGGCAWDSFALPHLVPGASPALVATRCPACDQPHAWNVTRQHPPEGDQVAHFLIPVAHMWDDVVRTCGAPADLLLTRLCRCLARSRQSRPGIHHGPGDPLAAGRALVRGTARFPVPTPGACRGGGVPTFSRSFWPVLGNLVRPDAISPRDGHPPATPRTHPVA